VAKGVCLALVYRLLKVSSGRKQWRHKIAKAAWRYVAQSGITHQRKKSVNLSRSGRKAKAIIEMAASAYQLAR